MAEEKGLLASAIETVKLMNLNGNGVHDEEASSASVSTGSETATAQESQRESAGHKADVAAESSEGLQIQRVVSTTQPVGGGLLMSEMFPLTNLL